MNQKPSSKWKLSLFATSFLALAGVTAAMAFDKKENIVYLEAEPIVEIAPENGTELPTVIEPTTETPQNTTTVTKPSTIKNSDTTVNDNDFWGIIIITKNEDPVIIKYPKSKVKDPKKFKDVAPFIVSKEAYYTDGKFLNEKFDLDNMQLATKEDKDADNYCMIVVSEYKDNTSNN